MYKPIYTRRFSDLLPCSVNCITLIQHMFHVCHVLFRFDMISVVSLFFMHAQKCAAHTRVFEMDTTQSGKLTAQKNNM